MAAVAAAPAPAERHSIVLHLAVAAGLALLPLLICLPGINTLGFHHGDEANYMQVAAHMLETGNYLVPIYHDRLILDRAPLLYWLIAASFRLFGMSLLAARLPSLLAAGCTLALIYWFVVRAYGSARGGVYAALAMAALPVTWRIMRLAVPDMLMTVGVFLAVACYCEATRGSHRRLFLLLASTGVGLAGMAKGHVGIVVATLPLAVLLVVDRRKAHALRPRELIGPWTWAPALIVGGWWYAYLLLANVPVLEFTDRHVDPQQTLGRALISFLLAEAQHQIEGGWNGLLRNLREYGPGIPLWFLPSSVYVLIGFLLGQRRLLQDWREHERPTTVLLSTIGSIVVLFVFFVLELRAMRFLVPIAPAVAILGTRWWMQREAARNRIERTPIVIAVAMLLFSTTFFGLVLPPATYPPLESVCTTLRPQLSDTDIVVTTGLREKWTTFAMVMLDRPVHSTGTDAQSLLEWAQRPRERQSGAAFVLTTPEVFERARQQRPDELALVSQGTEGWFATRSGGWEPVVLLHWQNPGAVAR